MNARESTIPARVLWQLVEAYEAERVAFISVSSLREALEEIERRDAAGPTVIPG